MQDTASVTLDSLGFKVASYQKSDQSIFGPRFGAGSVDETDLTLLKAVTFRAGDNGCYASKVAPLTPYSVAGAEYNPIGYLSKATVPTAAATLTLGGTTYSVKTTASVYWKGKTIYAVRISSGVNKLYQYDANAGNVEISLPAALSGSAKEITALIPFKGALWILTPILNGQFSLATDLTTITTPSTYAGTTVKQGFTLNSKMYFQGMDNDIWEFTGSTTVVTTTLISPTITSSAPGFDYDVYQVSMLNGRVYFAFTNIGLWCFDGVRAYQVLDGSSAGTLQCFNFVAAANGYIYTNKGFSLYRFNGSSIERIFDLPPNTTVVKACEAGDSLYFLTNTGYGSYEANIKGGGGTGQYGYMLFKYDGTNIYQIDDYRITTANGVFATWVSITPSYFGVVTTVGLEYTPAGTSNSVYVVEYKNGVMYSELTTPAILSFQDEDFGLPSIEKKIIAFQFVFQKTVDLTTGSKNLKIYYRLDETAVWTLCKTFSGSNATIYRGDSDVDIPAAKRIFFRCDIDGVNIQFTRFSVYYLILPPLKLQWNLALNPATNTLEAPSAYDNTYYAKLAALRTAGTKFTFVDLNGVSYNTILDSFVQRIDPVYSGTSSNYESQFSVVLREV